MNNDIKPKTRGIEGVITGENGKYKLNKQKLNNVKRDKI